MAELLKNVYFDYVGSVVQFSFIDGQFFLLVPLLSLLLLLIVLLLLRKSRLIWGGLG